MEKGSENQQALIMGLQYLVNISYVEADEVLKICLDYWNLFVPDVYTTSQTTDNNAQFSFGPVPTVCVSLLASALHFWLIRFIFLLMRFIFGFYNAYMLPRWPASQMACIWYGSILYKNVQTFEAFRSYCA